MIEIPFDEAEPGICSGSFPGRFDGGACEVDAGDLGAGALLDFLRDRPHAAAQVEDSVLGFDLQGFYRVVELSLVQQAEGAVISAEKAAGEAAVGGALGAADLEAAEAFRGVGLAEGFGLGAGFFRDVPGIAILLEMAGLQQAFKGAVPGDEAVVVEEAPVALEAVLVEGGSPARFLVQGVGFQGLDHGQQLTLRLGEGVRAQTGAPTAPEIASSPASSSSASS